MAFQFGASAQPEHKNPMGQLMSAPKPEAPAEADPMAMIGQILTALMSQRQDPLAKGKNNAMTIAALRNDPQSDRNRAYAPGAMAGTPDAVANPFTNGFFSDRLDRIAKEASAFGTSPVDTSTGANPGYLDQGQVAQQMVGQGQRYTNEVPSINYGPDVWDTGSDPRYTTAIPGGFEHMINPNLPADKRFQDANMGQIFGGLVKPKPRSR